jgi:hypothetical protein
LILRAERVSIPVHHPLFLMGFGIAGISRATASIDEKHSLARSSRSRLVELFGALNIPSTRVEVFAVRTVGGHCAAGNRSNYEDTTLATAISSVERRLIYPY